MNIGEVARASGVSAKMIRHYEESGIMRPAMRTDSNYRVYTARDVEILRFVRRARRLGFSAQQIAALLARWEDRDRPSSEVKKMVMQHIDDLNERIRELVEMRDTLKYLADHCKGDARPDCPILDELAADSASRSRASSPSNA
ncbi:TPA: Cu(I)-responsive transcriptional regulator [Burkholderia contaminans]|uniref:Cu(I)-responsive transcriptional regulator n=1 Tax=Burkholderia cepacia complex TaxID=87882 RepID=UPI0007569423|nr:MULTISPECIES: Cu(I)-responsive transcriptional regulator [Burkholderia cepacia complex]KVS22064.1 MerR family transcriptional regulator [Burkholderia vietnamiensis]MBM6430580.1 Cu(I)-responsive transcriptional regulator [Burkholderia contaminans]MCA7880837.1 Cu(I)-responsive transcriptional regulator [Burkholderia contaminans]MCB4349259.1 Cu(I)-responsive transcriptional regulator [Burkholderia vietnamiensis]MDN8025839.1 Cu(I)-responsive transcriptional regulator [Burkholderia contaminans]